MRNAIYYELKTSMSLIIQNNDVSFFDNQLHIGL